MEFLSGTPVGTTFKLGVTARYRSPPCADRRAGGHAGATTGLQNLPNRARYPVEMLVAADDLVVPQDERRR